MAQPSAIASQNSSEETTIRAGHEIALESCIGCHVASPQQEFRPVTGAGIPSLQDNVNRPGITAASLREIFDRTHRNSSARRTTSISTTTYISDLEAGEVITYMLTQRRGL
jgi:mono/diheme cytochrome c family protein